MKVEYGGALAESCPANTLVELPTPENREHARTTRRFVNEMLEARAEDLFRFVRSELARVGMEHALLGGVFLTGGAARLPDICDVAARVLQCQTRYGLAVGIGDWPEAMNNPEWCVAAGLAMYSAKLKTQAERQRESGGWLGKILKEAAWPADWTHGIMERHLKYEIEEEARSGTRIKVIGIGGGGCNAVARMVREGLEASSSTP